jgi:inorganic pyrophosphatase
MARALHELPAWTERGDLRVIVECVLGARLKLKYDPAIGAFTLARTLVVGAAFPCEFGFVPSTRAADGDPLDAVILIDAPTATGAALSCRPIALVEVTQRASKGRSEKAKKAKGGTSGKDARIRNDRVVAVACEDRTREGTRDLEDVPERVRRELESFFLSAVALEDKELRIERWADARAARAAIEEARRAARGTGRRP